MPKTMRRHMKRPHSDQNDKDEIDWNRLYEKALAYTQNIDPDEDSRVRLLEGGENSPKKVLKRLSILHEDDLKREFGKPEDN